MNDPIEIRLSKQSRITMRGGLKIHNSIKNLMREVWGSMKGNGFYRFPSEGKLVTFRLDGNRYSFRMNIFCAVLIKSFAKLSKLYEGCIDLT